MSLPIFNPSVPASPGTRNRPAVKVLKAEFGDGYTQEAGDGLNNVQAVLSLQWQVLTPDQAQELEDFFKGLGGYRRFLYREQPDRPLRKFVCSDWNRTYDTPQSFRATFEERFDLG